LPISDEYTINITGLTVSRRQITPDVRSPTPPTPNITNTPSMTPMPILIHPGSTTPSLFFRPPLSARRATPTPMNNTDTVDACHCRISNEYHVSRTKHVASFPSPPSCCSRGGRFTRQPASHHCRAKMPPETRHEKTQTCRIIPRARRQTPFRRSLARHAPIDLTLRARVNTLRLIADAPICGQRLMLMFLRAATCR
jgi:hypothetical protein